MTDRECFWRDARNAFSVVSRDKDLSQLRGVFSLSKLERHNYVFSSESSHTIWIPSGSSICKLPDGSYLLKYFDREWVFIPC